MTKRTRRGILYLLILIFLLVGGGAVLYAQGWRIARDRVNGGVAADKVGGIYLRTFPLDTSITMDGKPVKRRVSLLDRGILINNVFPGTHEIKIAAAGYRDWIAHLPVLPSRVTANSRVVMLPSSGTAATTTRIARILDLEERFYLETRRGDLLDSNLNVTNASSTNLGPYLKSANRIRALENDNFILVQSSSSLRLVDLGASRTITLESGGEVTAAAAWAGRIGWTTYDARNRRSLISIYDISANAFSREIDTLPGKIRGLDFLDRDTLYARLADGNLYALTPAQSLHEKLMAHTLSFRFAPDRTAVAITEPRGIHIIYPRRDDRYAFLAIPGMADLRNVVWYKDLNHLFLIYKDRISFLDINDLTLENNPAFSPAGEFAYSKEANVAYVLAKNELTKYQFPP